MAEGMTAKQIGHRMGIGVRTVKSYKAEIFARLGTQNMTSTVAVALREGLLEG